MITPTEIPFLLLSNPIPLANRLPDCKNNLLSEKSDHQNGFSQR